SRLTSPRPLPCATPCLPCSSARDVHSFPTRRSSDLSEYRSEVDGDGALPHPALTGTHRDDPAHPGQKPRIGFGSRDIAGTEWPTDRKSTRLNSSHVKISYAVFCLKKKNNKQQLAPPL